MPREREREREREIEEERGWSGLQSYEERGGGRQKCLSKERKKRYRGA